MHKKLCSILISILALSACGGGSSGKSTATASPHVENTVLNKLSGGAVSGRVANFHTGAGLPNIKVSVGERMTVTGADGSYKLSGTPTAEKVLVNFEGDGFAEHADTVYLDKNSANNILNVSLLPVGVTIRFDPTVQQTLNDPNSTARISLPAGALVKENGSAAKGDVTLNLTNIDPIQNINLMPGEMADANVGTTTSLGLIESFGAITATFEDSEGSALNLKEGAVSTIRIPLSDNSENPPSISPLYFYKKDLGLWVSEGFSVLVRSGKEAYYEGEVSHFSTWNADALFDQVFIKGCVEDIDGNRISNINVVANGLDYLNSANTVTDEQGNFSVAAKTNSSVLVFGLQLGVQTSSHKITTNTTDEVLSQCLVSSGGGISVKMSWRTPVDRDYGIYNDAFAIDEYLSSDLIGPKYEESGVYWDLIVSLVGNMLEFPFMDIFLSDPDHEIVSSGEELLIVAQFTQPGIYRYIVKNKLSEYFPGVPGEYAEGFIPSKRRISDSRVELNINGNITVFLPPLGEGGENVDWNTYPPGKEAPNITWEVFEFVVANDGSFTVVPLNNWLPQTEWNGQAPPVVQ